MSDPNSPVKKIRRVALTTNSENQDPVNFHNVIKSIAELKETAGNLQQQLNVIQGQLKIIIESQAENKVVLGKLLRQHYEELPVQKKFPVITEQKLIQLNSEISAANKSQYVKAMASLLGTGGVLKNFKYIIDDHVTMGFNVDGVHGKKSLKDLGNFYNALLEAVSSLTDYKGPAEEQIRKAMQRQKKRQFKNKSVTKTANTDSSHLLLFEVFNF